MSLYFLLEGKRTEMKVYTAWLRILLPNFKRVKDISKVANRSYYLFNTGGYPSILTTHLRNAILDINESGRFTHLILCLDSEGQTPESRTLEIDNAILNLDVKPDDCHIVPLIQNVCIETWFLGNKKVFKRNPSSDVFCKYVNFYDVSSDDPELMPIGFDFSTVAQFHFSYLKEMLKERNMIYTKKKPNGVVEESYLNSLIGRVKKTDHLQSFKTLFDFCEELHHKK